MFLRTIFNLLMGQSVRRGIPNWPHNIDALRNLAVTWLQYDKFSVLLRGRCPTGAFLEVACSTLFASKMNEARHKVLTTFSSVNRAKLLYALIAVSDLATTKRS